MKLSTQAGRPVAGSRIHFLTRKKKSCCCPAPKQEQAAQCCAKASRLVMGCHD